MGKTPPAPSVSHWGLERLALLGANLAYAESGGFRLGGDNPAIARLRRPTDR